MNKTLLLIIIDFLFLNLIALTRWDRATPARPLQPPVPEVAANSAVKEDDDLVEAMRQALADERATRGDLERKLAYADTALAAREQSVASLEGERTRLSSSLEGTERQAADLGRQLSAATREASLTQDQLAELRRELADRNAEVARQRSALAGLQQEQASSNRKIQDLTMAVVVTGAENQDLQKEASSLQAQVQQERTERIRVEQADAQLSKGVGQLAQSSTALTREIRENRPVNANVLYGDFLENQVRTTFTASRRGLFGPVVRTKTTPTVFTTDGRQVYALLHADDTVFSFEEPPGEEWTSVEVSFDRPASGYHGRASGLDFLALDPRVVAVPVDPAQAAALGVKVYALASDPFRFPEAVLISARGKGYGTVGFKLDPDHPGYVRVDNRLFKRLFGDFAPSRGDLVLSESGELLGIMVNGDYCALVKDFTPAATLRTGGDVPGQRIGATIDRLGADTRALPLDLQ